MWMHERMQLGFALQGIVRILEMFLVVLQEFALIVIVWV